jgi:DNA invertase Pin-like site-specific DNA recombinase
MVESHHKIKAHHLQKKAYLYVRQSSMRQVLENTESTKRQYELRERALALGWQSEQIRVIDCDQGRSGASEAGRDGFQHLVAEVSLGNAGIVMGLEVSRLARNNADWQKLLQLCAFTDSLILDQDGLYDPSSFNDRLLLGLKGTMSEAELHVLRTRLQEGILNKAKRGELKMPLPVGLSYDELDRVVLTPDIQVRNALQKFFESFQRHGAAFAVVREFRREGIQMPHYSRTGPKSSNVIWGDLTHSQALRILHNPRYSGAYAYGRCRSRRGPDGQLRYSKSAQDQWISLIVDAHDGYISWEEYQRNQQTLTANAQAYSNERQTPPREGPALLQGILICGRCGKRMTVRYHQRQGQLLPEYACQRDKVEQGYSRDCQRIPGKSIDDAVSQLLISTLNEESIDIAMAVRTQVQARLEEADHLRLQQVERCRYEADLARRRYLSIDPEKRYVAEVLEAEWNDKLRELDEAHSVYDQAREHDQSVLSQTQVNALNTLPDDFAAVWNKKTLGNRDRKRMVRLLIEDATLIRGENLTLHTRLKGGACRTLNLPLPRPTWEERQTDSAVIKEIGQLLDKYPMYQIAEILNSSKLRSGNGKEFTDRIVERIRITYKLPSRKKRLRLQGKLTALELADKLSVNVNKIRRCRKEGIIQAYEYRKGGYLYDFPGDDILTRFPQLRANSHMKTITNTTNEVQYAT